MSAAELPPGLTDWISRVGDGEITRLDRHVARREAWAVDVTRPDRAVLEGFLRLQRGKADIDPRRLERETRIIQALAETDVPVPDVYGWNGELRAALFQRDPGRSDIDRLEDPKQQRAIMEDFIRVIARLHRLDLDALGLDDIMDVKPTTAAECALGELDLVASQWQPFLDRYHDPLLSYALDWLRRLVPQVVARVSLVQGDTGPVNFMFQGNRVSAVIDWELAHYGDPMEDLGNICVREMFNPCGGLDGLFELYEKESGIPYNRFAAQYYRVQQNVRGMIPIHAACLKPHPRESVAWYLCYRYLGDRATALAIAEAMAIDVAPPDLPDEDTNTDVLAEAALYALEHDIGGHLDSALAESRNRDSQALIRCMDRRRRYGEAIAADNCQELAALLGTPLAREQDGFAEFDRRVAAREVYDGDALHYLVRKALREDWLYRPVIDNLYPDRSWARID